MAQNTSSASRKEKNRDAQRKFRDKKKCLEQRQKAEYEVMKTENESMKTEYESMKTEYETMKAQVSALQTRILELESGGHLTSEPQQNPIDSPSATLPGFDQSLVPFDLNRNENNLYELSPRGNDQTGGANDISLFTGSSWNDSLTLNEMLPGTTSSDRYGLNSSLPHNVQEPMFQAFEQLLAATRQEKEDLQSFARRKESTADQIEFAMFQLKSLTCPSFGDSTSFQPLNTITMDSSPSWTLLPSSDTTNTSLDLDPGGSTYETNISRGINPITGGDQLFDLDSIPT